MTRSACKPAYRLHTAGPRHHVLQVGFKTLGATRRAEETTHRLFRGASGGIGANVRRCHNCQSDQHVPEPSPHEYYLDGYFTALKILDLIICSFPH